VFASNVTCVGRPALREVLHGRGLVSGKGMKKAERRYGWAGKILRVDLTTGRTTDIPTSKYVPEFMGGRAWEQESIGRSASGDRGLCPENKLIFMTGPAVGTLAPTANRVTVTGKSPVPYPVECYFFSSMGGHWGPELKFAGYDGLVVQGRALEPSYLWIQDGGAEVRDAKHLWGKISRDAQIGIRKIHGETTDPSSSVQLERTCAERPSSAAIRHLRRDKVDLSGDGLQEPEGDCGEGIGRSSRGKAR